MKYSKSEAKEWAKQHLRGVWPTLYVPYTANYEIDEQGFRHNIRHVIDNLQLKSIYVGGFMGEAFTQTTAERKRIVEVLVEEAGDDALVATAAPGCLKDVLEMTKYAENIGADLVAIRNPEFYFGSKTDEGIFQFFKYIADRVNIGIFAINQKEHGYLMSPELISRIAEIENVVVLKNTAPTAEVIKARILCGDKIVVSESMEDHWFINLTVNGQEALMTTPAPCILQSKKLKLLNEYTTLAMKGEIAEAWEAYKRLEPIRRAFKNAEVPGKKQATYKYWTQSLGMVGGDGRVRLPLMELTKAEKQAIKAAVESTELV